MNPAHVIKGLEQAGSTVDRALSVLRVLGPVVDQVDKFIHDDGPEPAIFEQLPELRSPAALERARHRTKSNGA